jgi:hypothetical protein
MEVKIVCLLVLVELGWQSSTKTFITEVLEVCACHIYLHIFGPVFYLPLFGREISIISMS